MSEVAIKSVPELRFPEFDGEWEATSLNNVITIQSGFAFSSKEFGLNGSKLVTPKNFTKSGFGNFSNDFTKYTTEIPPEQFYCKAGDLLVLLTDLTSSCELLGKPLELKPEDGDVLLNQRVSKIIVKNENWTKNFLKQFFLTSTYHQHIVETASGSTVRHSSNKILHAIELFAPLLPEQQKIASFLSALDEKIALLDKKKALLEAYKKGVMQKLFSRTLRFKDDDGNEFPDWEEKRLGDVANIYQPETISQSNLEMTGKYFVYGANGIIGKLNRYNHEKEQVALTCRGNTCGYVTLTRPHSWITGNSMVINLDESSLALKRFIYYCFVSTDWRYLITGSGQPQITGEIKKHKLSLPHPDEQQKIANFLSAIDEKIAHATTQLDYAKTFKKGLLQKMFV